MDLLALDGVTQGLYPQTIWLTMPSDPRNTITTHWPRPVSSLSEASKSYFSMSWPYLEEQTGPTLLPSTYIFVYIVPCMCPYLSFPSVEHLSHGNGLSDKLSKLIANLTSLILLDLSDNNIKVSLWVKINCRGFLSLL